MRGVFILAEALVAVVLAAGVLAMMDLIGSVLIALWAPAMLVLGGVGTLGGLILTVYAIMQGAVWPGVAGVVGALFFAWIFVQELQLASTRSLEEPGSN